LIKIGIGGIGSGKSLSATKDICHTSNHSFCNWTLKLPNVTRLKREMIMEDIAIGSGRDGSPKFKKRVNWKFWEEAKQKHGNFSIYIDEIHNVANSRRAMSTWNVNFSTWITQIRKILQGHKHSHLVCMAQRIESIDPVIRDLANEITHVMKTETKTLVRTRVFDSYNKRMVWKDLPRTVIHKFIFKGEYCLDKYLAFRNGMGHPDSETAFVGNKYFKYFDTFEMIRFGDDVYV